MTKEERREYHRKWYLKNKERRVAINAKWQLKNREWLKEYKKSLFCVRCGESHPACLDFHHIDPSQKKYAIAAIHTFSSIEKIKEEIAKCIVLCSNCHRKEHYRG